MSKIWVLLCPVTVFSLPWKEQSLVGEGHPPGKSYPAELEAIFRDFPDLEHSLQVLEDKADDYRMSKELIDWETISEDVKQHLYRLERDGVMNSFRGGSLGPLIKECDCQGKAADSKPDFSDDDDGFTSTQFYQGFSQSKT